MSASLRLDLESVLNNLNAMEGYQAKEKLVKILGYDLDEYGIQVPR